MTRPYIDRIKHQSWKDDAERVKDAEDIACDYVGEELVVAPPLKRGGKVIERVRLIGWTKYGDLAVTFDGIDTFTGHSMQECAKDTNIQITEPNVSPKTMVYFIDLYRVDVTKLPAIQKKVGIGTPVVTGRFRFNPLLGAYEPVKEIKRFPHKCPLCAKDALQMFNSWECSNGSCRYAVRT